MDCPVPGLSIFKCCKSGFKWNGTSTGKETSLGKNQAYVTGDNKDAAVLIVCDVFGWKLPNVRLLADHYAKEANVTVYVPDYFDGEVVDEDALSNPEKREKFDVMAFIGRNSKEIRYPEILANAKELKSQYKKVGAIGFCYGAWAVLRLAGKDEPLIDSAAVAHPSLLEESEIANIGVPVQFISPETDPMFTPELKEFTLKTLPGLNVPFNYDYYPGLVHGFATRGDQSDPKQKEGLERAKNSAVYWFKQFLH
ncbi:alpha/beta-hydrolase [Aureobasidium pullulans]|nr:alpha/beta-hydrolase [Aureobasidium pullulans]THZ97693.1 alpha/beta-hydrolase [Aureobasidium pullulans]